jgi:hypothetical protein
VLRACSDFIGGWIQSGDNLDRWEWTSQAPLHIAEAQSEAKIWWRFGGGSDRNRALLGNPMQPVHDMQIVQSRINTGYFASR